MLLTVVYSRVNWFALFLQRGFLFCLFFAEVRLTILLDDNHLFKINK